jgi:hypothetical protein
MNSIGHSLLQSNPPFAVIIRDLPANQTPANTLNATLFQFFYAHDRNQLFFNNGTSWVQVNPPGGVGNQILIGTSGNQPPASAETNQFYYATDLNALSFSNGAAWTLIAAQILEGASGSRPAPIATALAPDAHQRGHPRSRRSDADQAQRHEDQVGTTYWSDLPTESLAMAGLYQGQMQVGLLAVLVAALSSDEDVLGRWLSRPWPIYLGEVSYSIYMIHWFVLAVLRHGVARVLPQLNAVTLPFVGLCLVVTLLAASLLYRVIEAPGRRFLRAPLPQISWRFAKAKVIEP